MKCFWGVNIKNLFGSRESRALYYASVCFRHGYCIQIIALILVIINYKSYICLI